MSSYGPMLRTASTPSRRRDQNQDSCFSNAAERDVAILIHAETRCNPARLPPPNVVRAHLNR